MLRIYRATIDRTDYEGVSNEYEAHFTSKPEAISSLEDAKKRFKVDWESDPCGECADDGDDLLEAYVSEIDVYETRSEQVAARARLLGLN